MTKETKDLGAAPPRSLTEIELEVMQKALRAATPPPWYDAGAYTAGWIRSGDGANIFELSSGTDADLEAVVKLWNAATSLISELRGWRGRLLEAEMGLLAHSAAAVPVDAIRDWLAFISGVEGAAPQAPPDSSSALLEARRLLGECADWIDRPGLDSSTRAWLERARDFLGGRVARGWRDAEWARAVRKSQHGDSVDLMALVDDTERSDSERSEPARSESGGSKVVHDPTEEGR